MAKRKNSRNRKRRAKNRQNSDEQVTAQDPDIITHILYGFLALFWLYAAVSSTIETTVLMESEQQSLPWLVPAAVALFAVGWFWFHYVYVNSASGRQKLAQGLLIAFFLIFLAGMVPVFLGESELVRNGARAYISFGLTGLFLRMSTQKRQRAGFFGSIFSSRDKDDN